MPGVYPLRPNEDGCAERHAAHERLHVRVAGMRTARRATPMDDGTFVPWMAMRSPPVQPEGRLG